MRFPQSKAGREETPELELSVYHPQGRAVLAAGFAGGSTVKSANLQALRNVLVSHNAHTLYLVRILWLTVGPRHVRVRGAAGE